jgi:hypothetical protein
MYPCEPLEPNCQAELSLCKLYRQILFKFQSDVVKTFQNAFVSNGSIVSTKLGTEAIDS